MKKLAIFALTKQGVKLGKLIINSVSKSEIDLFVPEALREYIDKDKAIFPCRTARIKVINKSLKGELAKQFSDYDGLVMIMALGIVCRTIAPLIKDKRTDPAVLCLDEKGQFVISVLSGHLGGANKLAKLIGEKIKATPVITTATDVNNTISFDLLAQKYNLGIEPFANLKFFNGAMVNGEKVNVYTNLKLPLQLKKEFSDCGVDILPLAQFEHCNDNNFNCVIVEEKPKLKEDYPINVLYLLPKDLIVGVGCRKDTPTDVIIEAIEQGIAQINRSTASIKIFVSVDVKEKEEGLLKAASHFMTPVKFFSSNQLQEVIEECKLSKSQFVNKTIGVEGVCEPAAILGGTNPQLILRKTIYPKTTIAISKEKFSW